MGRKLEKCIAIGGLNEELYCKTKKGLLEVCYNTIFVL